MTSMIVQQVQQLAAYQQVLASLEGGISIPALGLPRAARLPVTAALHADIQWPVLLITDRADHAMALFDEAGFWLNSPRYLFGEPNPLFYEQAAWGAATRRDRLNTLAALAAYHLPFTARPETPPLIVSSVRALMTRTMPRRDFLKACMRLAAGNTIQPEKLLQAWIRSGYTRVNTVLEAGQFSHRGGLLDIWPASQASPVRLDFFGDELESIRSFDPATQRTLQTLEEVLVAPGREFILAEPQILKSLRLEEDGLEEDRATEFLIPVLHPAPASLLDYLPAKCLVLIDDASLASMMANEIEEQAVHFRKESVEEGLLPSNYPIPYITWSELFDNIHGRRSLELGRSEEGGMAAPGSLADAFGHIERFAGRLKPFEDYLARLVQEEKTVTIVSRQSPRLHDLWRQRAGSFDSGAAYPAGPQFIEASLSEGWRLNDFFLITDSEVFGWERPQPRTHQRPAVETPETLYADLQVGDLVVHVDHGIGRFTGLVQRRLENHDREFLAVEYDSGDLLFVPVHQADRLTRYIGADAAAPSLDHLAGQGWSDKKARVKEAVQRVAVELLELYARRQISQGHAFPPDTAWQKELEGSFPYVETNDQTRALEEIKLDMQLPRPMDRLLCGDVGYGKTEVALRAAFKAVMDGRQVAILVPTTVLAQQHYETFVQRLAAFPVQVEMLSRFRSSREQAAILSALATGDLDIIIGTHRLISADVQFRDLGLVIIDEEQRFGVTHKEHLKKLRTEVDVLTLTATPIPRTLYMALSGVRDISNLNTAPEERLPIVTHVGPYSPRLVRQAVLRELERGGQIFFVHNRVHTIDAMKSHLERLVPEARVDIGHGQMPEQELSAVMHRFNAGQVDILLSTTIIESGLDIPNANTLIVDRADTFGLAQLYQLRGRVGRGAMRAYAYFFRHNKVSPTLEGQQRLEVIAENTQLGAGYSIAMRDLEIRGAGELLGTRQHGFIQDVGFHLYTRLLADAVRRLRGGMGLAAQPLSASPFNLPLAMPVNVDLPLAIGIPPEYIPDQDLRLRLYRRIADLRDEGEIEALGSEFQDRFGLLPDMVKNLLYQMRIKLRAEDSGLSSIGWENGQIVLRYPPAIEGEQPARLPDLGEKVRGGRGAWWCNFGKDPDWMTRLLDVLGILPPAPH